MGYWRASKRWCKQLPSEAVSKALAMFANNEAGLQPSDVYGGPAGALTQLQQLAAWFQVGWLPALAPENALQQPGCHSLLLGHAWWQVLGTSPLCSGGSLVLRCQVCLVVAWRLAHIIELQGYSF